MNKKLIVPSLLVVAVALLVVAGIKGCVGKPKPTKAPINYPGLAVLIVEESDDRSRVPAGQAEVLKSTLIQAEVESHGGVFKQYDDDPEIADPVWRDARNRPRTGLPWIIVSNPTKGGVEQPLPASVDDTLALIRSFE